MRATERRWIALRVAGLLAVLLLCAYALERFAERLVEGPRRVLTAETSTMPPGADDPSNPGILVEGGTFVSTSDVEGADTHFSPFYTGDEGFGRQTVGGFWMQEHEVTNAEYRRFDPAHTFPAGRERHPVVGVTWEEAMDYAASLGGTLPTELQWEYAASGTGSRTYPWGEAPPTCERAQFGDCEQRGTIEVGTRPGGATPEGIHDLAGNAWEWVRPNWFVRDRTPVNRASRRMRGGSFRSQAFFLRAVNRSNDFHRGFVGDDVGFRVAWPLDRGRR